MWIRILHNNKKPKMQDRNGGVILEEWLYSNADKKPVYSNKRTQLAWLWSTPSFRDAVLGGKASKMCSHSPPFIVKANNEWSFSSIATQTSVAYT